jgi:hypothetical protein
MREVNDRTDVLSHRVAEEHGHASITVTAHVYADLYDENLMMSHRRSTRSMTVRLVNRKFGLFGPMDAVASGL